MMLPQAVIFDLGGTLVDVPRGEEEMNRRWMLSYHALTMLHPDAGWPDGEAYVRAMGEAEAARLSARRAGAVERSAFWPAKPGLQSLRVPGEGEGTADGP
jgi:putative hydrolase of the HAD superfamily